MRILDAFKTEKDLSYEQIKPYLGKGYMIHFSTGRPVQTGFTNYRHDPMLTLNTKFLDEETPLAIYAYPLDSTWDKYSVEKNKGFQGYPFAGNRPYIHVLGFKSSAKVWNLDKLTSTFVDNCLGDLGSHPDVKRWAGDTPEDWDAFLSWYDQLAHDPPGKRLWRTLKTLSTDIAAKEYTRNRNSTFIWNGLLRFLGADAVEDTQGVIYKSEPIQTAILNPRAIFEVGVAIQREPVVRNGMMKEPQYFSPDQDPKKAWAVGKKYPWLYKFHSLHGYKMDLDAEGPVLTAYDENASLAVGNWYKGTVEGGELREAVIYNGTFRNAGIIGCTLFGGLVYASKRFNATVMVASDGHQILGPRVVGHPSDEHSNGIRFIFPIFTANDNRGMSIEFVYYRWDPDLDYTEWILHLSRCITKYLGENSTFPPSYDELRGGPPMSLLNSSEAFHVFTINQMRGMGGTLVGTKGCPRSIWNEKEKRLEHPHRA